MAVRLGTNPIAWTNDDMPELGGDTPLETCLGEAREAGFSGMGTAIEKASEIDRLMEGTPDSVGLLFDTGHLTFAGDDPAHVARKWAKRINHVHAKDVRPDILEWARKERWSFLDSVVNGVYTVPGDGCVDFASVLRPIAEAGYDGWLIVEAEHDPAKAHPLTYAKRGYAHLRRVAEEVGFRTARS
jgi:inosose dehydratase